jgi:hypothetical protein
LLFILIVLPSASFLAEFYFGNVRIIYLEVGILSFIFIYSLSPLFISTKKVLGIIGTTNYLIEFELLKKLIFAGLPLLIVALTLSLLNVQRSFLFPLFFLVTIIISSVLLRLFSNVIKRDYRFYYAKACFCAVSTKVEETDKINCIVKALNSYNKYLKRNIKLQISNIKNIYSKILIDPTIEQNEFVISISRAFESNDKFQPLRNMLNFLDTQNSERFLIEESIWDKTKEIGTFLVAVVPVLISIVELFIKIPPA